MCQRSLLKDRDPIPVQPFQVCVDRCSLFGYPQTPEAGRRGTVILSEMGSGGSRPLIDASN